MYLKRKSTYLGGRYLRPLMYPVICIATRISKTAHHKVIMSGRRTYIPTLYSRVPHFLEGSVLVSPGDKGKIRREE